MARICMLLNNFEPPFGGPELQAIAISSRLIERGHKVIIVAKGTGNAPGFEKINGIAVCRLNLRGLGSVAAWFQLLKLKDQFDIIHVHGVGRLASVAILFAQQYQKRVYIKVTTAGHIVKEVQQPGLAGILKSMSPFRDRKVALLQQADGIIAISKEIVEELNKHKFTMERIFLIPNGVDPDKFHPVTDGEKGELRVRLGLPRDKVIFLFTGKITKRKGIDTLLQAWAGGSALHAHAVLVLVGSGAGQSDNLEPWAACYIKEHNLNGSVILIGEHNNIPDYLAASDCFVFPSRREGLPNSLLEAMATQLVCVTSDIGGNRDLIVNDDTGILVPVDDIPGWSRTLEKIVFHLDRSLGSNAASFIHKNYSLQKTVARLEELYAIT